jgi:hypothetical protein
MHRSFGLMLLAMTSVAVPAFAQTENRPTGTWRGSVERNGEQSPMILRLMQKNGLWKGRADVGGSASPLTKVQVAIDSIIESSGPTSAKAREIMIRSARR